MKSGVLIVAIVLIAIGVVSLAYQGITYTTREKVLEVGPDQGDRREGEDDPAPADPGRAGARRRSGPARGGSAPVARRPNAAGGAG